MELQEALVIERFEIGARASADFVALLRRELEGGLSIRLRFR
jgi:hypothetical protein